MPMMKPGETPPKKGRGSKPTAKMLRFVEEYPKDLDGPRAAERAGYKTKNVYKLARDLLVHPLLVPLIKEKLKAREERMIVEEDYIIQGLMRIAKDNEETSPQNAIRALELLGKHLGMFKERTEISGPDGEAIAYKQQIQEVADDFTTAISRLAERHAATSSKERENPFEDFSKSEKAANE